MQTLPVRLEPGADLRAALEAVLVGRRARAGFVIGGIGSLACARLRLAGRVEWEQFEGDFEILTLAGSLSTDGAHLHMSMADTSGRVTGGHVGHGCRVRTTAEVLLVLLPSWSFARMFDPVTGFDELDIREAPSRE